MTRIVVKNIKTGNISKRISDLNKYLKNDITREAYKAAEENVQNRWRRDIPKVFNVRSSMGLQCDGILAKSLGILQRGKNSVIVYVEPIVRFSKGSRSSGGAVNNLTSILFRGSARSFGKYYPRWDARVQSGMHPGTSPSTMRNYWSIFKKYAKEEIRRGLRKGLIKKFKGKK